jgi:hypothetical protein
MIMKSILILLSLFISSVSFAQSNLPPCTSEPFNNCYGNFTYPNGDKYVGEWKDDKKNGQGTYTWGDGSQWNGDKYVGQYIDGKGTGQGTYTFANGDKYLGQFFAGKRTGQGTYTFADGEKYVGQFKDDNYDGFGTFYNANGSIYQQGLWRDNEFVQVQSPPVVPKPPANNAQDIKRQKCIRLGLVPGSVDFQQCMN